MAQTYHLRIPLIEEDSTNISISLIHDLRETEYFNVYSEFLEELERFANRNKIPCPNHPDQVCMRCLKAHAKRLLRDHEKNKINTILSLFNCPTGHNGYYQDCEIIREV